MHWYRIIDGTFYQLIVLNLLVQFIKLPATVWPFVITVRLSNSPTANDGPTSWGLHVLASCDGYQATTQMNLIGRLNLTGGGCPVWQDIKEGMIVLKWRLMPQYRHHFYINVKHIQHQTSCWGQHALPYLYNGTSLDLQDPVFWPYIWKQLMFYPYLWFWHTCEWLFDSVSVNL